MHELSPKGEKSFFEFYVKNQVAVDGIINANIGRFVQPTVRDDIRQDLLIIMERCDVLGGYAESKSAFNTYFTRVVKGYILHWFDKQRTPSWRPYPNGPKEKNSLRYERAYYKAFNGLVNEDDESIPLDVAIMPTIEDELSLEQACECLRGKLEDSVDESLVDVFDLVVKGHSNTEISRVLKTCEANVSVKTTKIKNFGKKVSR